MDSLLAGMLTSLSRGGLLAIVMSSAPSPPTDLWKSFRADRERHSGVERNPFAFSPESLFAISQEWCSSSARNRFRVHPGIPFALLRIPHPDAKEWEMLSQIDSEEVAGMMWDASIS
jgi:hypothetical protein